MGALAVFALFRSDLKLGWAIAVAALALGWSAVLAWRESRRPVLQLGLTAVGKPLNVIERGVESHPELLSIAFRGPFVLLAWRTPDGRVVRSTFWPDAMAESERRALRRRFGSQGDSVVAGMTG